MWLNTKIRSRRSGKETALTRVVEMCGVLETVDAIGAVEETTSNRLKGAVDENRHSEAEAGNYRRSGVAFVRNSQWPVLPEWSLPRSGFLKRREGRSFLNALYRHSSCQKRCTLDLVELMGLQLRDCISCVVLASSQNHLL